ncbi:MAG: hypothetical protein ACOYOK_09805 [Pseudobdellovibrionaceae bacterium]|jgi:hypothetical protein
MQSRWGVLFGLILISSFVQAKVFTNAYITFTIPDTWKCNLEQTEWVCRSENNKEAKEAIIILTAKEVGPTDSFPLYEAHLNAPITSTGAAGQALTSKLVYKAKNSKINDHVWLDSLHLSGEVNNYYTRYMATIKDRIAVLVTLSAHQSAYTKYSKDFIEAVNSLRVIPSKNLLARSDNGSLRPGGSEIFGGPGGASLLTDPGLMGADGYVAKTSKKTSKLLYVFIAVLFAAAGGYFWWRSKQK